jgi:hypothetical protein
MMDQSVICAHFVCFYYFHGDARYTSFSKLNSRFDHLINNNFFSLKINLRPRTTLHFKHLCQHLIYPNRHRILSLCLEKEFLMNDFFTYYMMDSSFTRFQSIILQNLDNYIIPLFHFKSLSNLSSLIDEQSDYNLNNIYRMIFAFPS